MTNNNQTSLPSSWSLTKLGEITEINSKLGTELPSELEVSFIPMRCVAEMSGEIDLSIIRHYKEVRTGYTHFQDGDVIFAKITPCMENGKVAIVNKLKNGIGFGSTEFHVIRPLAQMPSSLLFLFLIQESVRGDAQRHMTGTAGQLRVPVKYLSEVLFPLPPSHEQHRIAAKIEELFTKLDAGVEALEKIKLQLKRYRQSVLKAAFEGRLTSDWREAHKGELEPASVLPEGIKAERARSGKYKELPPLDTADLPELPEGWEWTRLDQILEKYESGGRPKGGSKNIDAGIPSVGGEHLTDTGRFNFKNIRYVPVEFFKRMNKGIVTSEDILIVKDGATTGKTSIIRNDFPYREAAVNEHVFLLRPFPEIDRLFAFYYLFSPYGQDWVRKNFRGTAQGGITLSFFFNTYLPLPSLSEQHVISDEIERNFSIIDNIEKTVEQSLNQSSRLRQGILKKAFEGKLVPQDPNDEPAEKLLERIKVEKSRQQASSNATRSRNKRNLSQGRLV